MRRRGAAVADPLVITTPEQLAQLIELAVERAVSKLQPPRAANDDALLTVHQAAAIAQCSAKAVRQACRGGLIEGATQPPGMNGWRIPPAGLRAWVARDRPRRETLPPVDPHSEADRVFARLRAGKQRG
jgi:hypothetical protein